MKRTKNGDIVIIGGGIGGLTMALSLHQRGIPCRVFEAASEFRPLGVGINMMPHAIRVLSTLGLEENLNRYGVEAKEFAYFNRHGQEIFTEPCGRFAGYEYPHFSIHRGDLHQVLYEAVVERLGVGAVSLGHRCAGVEQDADGVTVRFEDAPEQHGRIALAFDGFHSALRHQFYPDEAPPQFGGINMWRGVTRRKPFLTGASVTRVGTVQVGKMVIYAIRQFDDGTQLINWNTEQPRDDHKLNDWATPGRIEDFI
jgi:2-polyprenyl-6-methoxyphenol hydroxylase-like FAD-dependent oxidoreductase